MKPLRKRVLLALLPVLAFAATLALPASAHTPAVYLDGAERWTESDCEGETPIVVASDSKAQADIYAAVMLAGVLETDCVILAGERNQAFPADQLQRFDNSEGAGFIVGGTSAIPETKSEQFDGREMTRITGETRWNTLANVGRTATGKELESVDTTQPEAEDNTNGFTSASAAYAHSCALRANGSVECWGADHDGEASPPSGSFTAVSANGRHSCGIRTDKTIECWGADHNGQASPPSGSFTAVAAGGFHSCGIRTNGSVECWGYNQVRQSSPPSGSFTAVSAGGFHSCGVRTNGSVECWGADNATDYDGTGDSVGLGQSSPPSGSFTAISAGGYHSCGIRTNGSVECWGDDRNGEASPPSGSFTAVSASSSYSCGIRTDKTIECWGHYNYGYRQVWPPSGSFTAVSAGSTHSCGIRTNGAVFCWGSDYWGQVSPPSS